VKCNICHARYVGCTTRPLHLRSDEHLKKDKKSAVFLHKSEHSNTTFAFSILDQGRDKVDVTFRVDHWIKALKPELNGKDNILEFRTV